SRNWIELRQKHFNKSTYIVLGYGGYQKHVETRHALSLLLNKMIRFDTLTIAIQYFSFALNGNAYMGVGRNLAYRKSLFFQNKGFAKHNHIFSGDDDLFVNENATGDNVAIEFDPASFTCSLPKQTFNDWLKQKARHGSTSSYYKSKHKNHLEALHLSDLFFILLF